MAQIVKNQELIHSALQQQMTIVSRRAQSVGNQRVRVVNQVVEQLRQRAMSQSTSHDFPAPLPPSAFTQDLSGRAQEDKMMAERGISQVDLRPKVTTPADNIAIRKREAAMLAQATPKTRGA